MFEPLRHRVMSFYEKYESRLEIAFFVGGFIADVLLAAAPDEILSIVQQAVYLWLIAALIHFEILFRKHKWRPTGVLVKVWDYRTLFLHFLLGSLLNMYSIFYIKSASLLNSIIFLALMIAVILGNELPQVKKAKVSMKVVLYMISLFSFFSVLFPVILGFVGWVPFALSMAASLILFYFQMRFLMRRLQDQKTMFKALMFPGFGVLTAFILFYVLGWIPPVPLSVKEQGIYHLIEKKDHDFFLSTEKLWWKFWQSGDSDFYAQAGDKIYFYAQIYSPGRFSDQVFIHWFMKDPQGGWKSVDRIPMKINGGREQGYRGYAVKANHSPGQWRVAVETTGGQEISRLYFTVTNVSEPTSTRTFTVLKR